MIHSEANVGHQYKKSNAKDRALRKADSICAQQKTHLIAMNANLDSLCIRMSFPNSFDINVNISNHYQCQQLANIIWLARAQAMTYVSTQKSYAT